MAKLRSTITEVINKYGNLIPQNLKMSIAHEIVERLSSDGVLEDDDTNFIQNTIEEFGVMDEVDFDNVTALDEPMAVKAPVLSASDKLHLENRKKEQDAKDNKKNKRPSKPKTGSKTRTTTTPTPGMDETTGTKTEDTEPNTKTTGWIGE